MTTDGDRAFLRELGLTTWQVNFDEGYEDTDRTPVPFDIANAVGSSREEGKDFERAPHAVLLDIDHHRVRLIPSSTPGHHHLVIEGMFLWEHYRRLLEVLSDMGIVEYGYASLSMERGQAFLRMPGVEKRPRPQDDLLVFPDDQEGEPF